MHKSVTLVPPSGQFWTQCAHRLIMSMDTAGEHARDYSAARVIVPAFEHAALLTWAMAKEVGDHFIPPRINTIPAWLAMQMPAHSQELAPVPEGERLMALYAQLREHAWLKKLFSARKNTDLLPLAQTLITLSDELTEAMLPGVLNQGAEQVWHQAMAQLPEPVQHVLSDEAQLVWQIWTSQLDGQDAISLRFQKMLRLAERSTEPLFWLNPVLPVGLDEQFLEAYAKRNPVHVISLDWRANGLPAVLGAAWPEIVEKDREGIAVVPLAGSTQNEVSHVSTLMADSLEQEAEWGAQTILTWLQQGKSSIALIAQDRVCARRIRAFLERAGVHVSDETGWKLSTTRAAAVLIAWFDVVVTRADTVGLLDLLKSPYFEPDSMSGFDEKSTWVMAIEMALLRANVAGGWDAIIYALEKSPDGPACVVLIEQLKRASSMYSERKRCLAWLELTQSALSEFGIPARWQKDEAGSQVAQLLDQLRDDCAQITDTFSFSEWRMFINLQLEEASFQESKSDSRVVMLPLNGARCRQFDAVLMAGCDAAHLPSPNREVLFFTNAVRRECGLITREQRQRQQLRDFAEVLLVNPEVVLSWQRQKQGEDNPVSPWILRLNLHLARSGAGQLKSRHVELTHQTLDRITLRQPRPAAPNLQPSTLSASGYNRFIACPYQFFATRMLGLSALDTLSDMPEKRDYGGWLHAILKTYHDTLKSQPAAHPKEKQEALLQEISTTMFAQVVKKNPAALGYSQRWKKVIPAYISWSQSRADSGWQFEAGEIWLESQLEWAEGAITLRGQIDRVDKNQRGEFAVLDYKTNPISALKKKLTEAEDQQLPFYGLLAEQNAMPVTSAHYVALEMTYEKLTDAAIDNAEDNYAARQANLKKAIIQNMRDIGRGAALPAQGVSQVCQYCDVRGLCRKGAW